MLAANHVGHKAEGFGHVTTTNILNELKAITCMRITLAAYPGAAPVLIVKPETVLSPTRRAWTVLHRLGRDPEVKCLEDGRPAPSRFFSDKIKV